MSDGEHPLEYVFRSLRGRRVEAIPVVGLLRANDYLQACRNIVTQDNRDVCVRIQREDFEEFGNLGSEVQQILETVGANLQSAHLVLDLRELKTDEHGVAVIDMIRRLPQLRRWRTFTITATSFPRNLMGLPPSDSSLIPRREWALWTNILRSADKLARIPTFGDYAISNPEPAEVDPRIMRPSASVRYTCEANWLVLKGRNLSDHGYKQFHEVSRALVQMAEYAGRQFSWGDKYIDDCAAERVSTGSLSTWRQVGTSHHLAFVARQLATGSGS